jgi:hypothetical protein
MPPAASTLPLGSSVAVKANRAVFMLPVAVHVPGVWAVVVVADMPVTKTGFAVADLLHQPKLGEARLSKEQNRLRRVD